MATQTTSNDSILRWPEVQARIGLSRSHVHYLISKGNFPRQLKLGPRASGWLKGEIDEWLAQRIAESRPDDPEAA